MTEYTVGLRYVVNSAVGDPLKYADKLAASMASLESRSVKAAARNTAFQKSNFDALGRAAQKAADREAAINTRKFEQLGRAAQRSAEREASIQARGMAARQRLQDRSAQRDATQGARAAQTALKEQARQFKEQAREEDRFARYRIGLNRKFAREKATDDARQQRVTEQRLAAQQKAEEKAQHKSYFGGHKSITGLFAARADNKATGLASGAADAILDAPGRIVSGAFGAAGALAEGAASAAFNFGKMAISAQAMREDSVSGFTAVFGSAEEANRLFDAARTAAKQTKFDTQDVVKDFNTIAAAGFGSKEIERIYWTSADVGSARGNQKQQQYMRGLSKLNAQDSAMFGTFQQAAMAGPGLKNAEGVLAKKLKIKGGNVDGTLRSMFRGHQIKGNVALESVIESTNQLYNKKTGRPGEYAQALGNKSWAGMISNIKNGLSDVLNMKLDDNHPINKFKKILEAIGSEGGLFDETKERGQRFAALMGRFAEDVFSIFGGVSDDVGGTMNTLLTLGEKVEQGFRKVTEYIRTDMVPQIMDGIDSPDIDGALTRLVAKITIIMAKGIVMGISGAIETYIPDPQWLVNLRKNTDGTSQIQPLLSAGDDRPISPLIPSMAGGGVVPGPFGRRKMIEAHGGEIVSGLHGEYAGAMARAYPMAGGGSMGGGASLHLSFNLPVTTSQDPAQLTSQAAPMIMAQLIPALDRYYGRLAAQGPG